MVLADCKATEEQIGEPEFEKIIQTEMEERKKYWGKMNR